MPAHASGVRNAAAPAASAVQATPAQPMSEQIDETASVRSGVVTAVSERGDRIQVQGVWLDVVDGKSKVFRQGKPISIDAIKVGTAIKFMVVPGVSTPVLKVIYAP